jgi:hypothetical protein
MRALTVNQQLLQWLEQSRANLMSAIAGLSEGQMSVPDIGGWSVKDHLAHLTLWDEMRFFEVSRIARGGAASFPVTEAVDGVDPIDEINERFAANRRGLPLAQVLSDLDFAREMVKQAVAAAPEDRLSDSLFGELGPAGAGHEAEHADTIRAWRKREEI